MEDGTMPNRQKSKQSPLAQSWFYFMPFCTVEYISAITLKCSPPPPPKICLLLLEKLSTFLIPTFVQLSEALSLLLPYLRWLAKSYQLLIFCLFWVKAKAYTFTQKYLCNALNFTRWLIFIRLYIEWDCSINLSFEVV